MKIEKLNLREYLRFGGKIEKIDWSKAYSEYGDKNRKIPIVSFEDKGETNGYDEKLWHFTFENGVTNRYALSWITLNVTFVLHESYLS